MCKPRSTWSHSFPVPVSHSLQVSLLASQPTESAAGGEPCGEPAISHDSHHVSLVQWNTCLLPATRDTGSNPLGGLMWNRDSPVSVVLLQSDVICSPRKAEHYYHHWWAPKAKNVDWIEADNRWTLKKLIIHKKSSAGGRKNLSKMKNFSPMDRFYRWSAWPIILIDCIVRYYRYRSITDYIYM